MTYPSLKTRTANIAGIEGPIEITEMNALCFVEVMDAKAAEKSPIEVAAIVAHHCVRGWDKHPPQKILKEQPPAILTDIMREVNTFAGDDEGNSVADQVEHSSSS